MKKLRFITFHYVSLLITIGLFSIFPSAFAQNLNWIKQISGSGTDLLRDMVTDASGNIYATGFFTGTIDLDPGLGNATYGPAIGSDIWVAKYTSAGSLVWGFGLVGGDDDASLGIALDNSNNVYITGYFGLSSPLDFNIGTSTNIPTVEGSFIAKYNTNGVFQWVRVINGSGTAQCQAIAVNGSGNVFVAGFFGLYPGGQSNFGGTTLNSSNGRMFLARYTSSGTLSWAKNFGGGWAVPNSIALDASNNVYSTGEFTGVLVDFNAGTGTTELNSVTGGAFIVKYNSSGAFTWAKQVNGQNGDIGFACTVDASNNAYVTGRYNVNGSNIFLAKFNSSGTQQQFKSIGGSLSDAGQSLKLDGSGNIFMAGYFYGSNVDFNPGGPPQTISASTYTDFFLTKYSTSALDCQWARNVDVQTGSPDPEVKNPAASRGALNTSK